jgi:hypothetical protein
LPLLVPLALALSGAFRRSAAPEDARHWLATTDFGAHVMRFTQAGPWPH